jgi:two-component system phosphate regulon sensor histidine kinase PhoR
VSVRFHSKLIIVNFVTIAVGATLLGYFAISSTAQLVAVIALAAGVALLIGMAVNRLVSTPLRDIAEASHQLAIGNLEYRVPEAGDTDLAIVSSSLNRMAVALNQKMLELEEDRRRFESILNAMSSGVVVFDRQARAVIANPSVQKLLGVHGEPIGRTAMELVRHPAVQEAVRESVEGHDDPPPVNITTASGRILSAKAAPVRNRMGETALVVVVFHDLTEIRRTENMRREFVANVSHEFKTPLTSIKGYAETLLSVADADPQVVREFLNVIHRNASILQGLIEDLLVLSNLERDFPVNRELIDVGQLVQEQINLRRASLSERSINVHIDCVPEQLPADRTRLARAISNLLDNAIHYNEDHGDIRITVRREDLSWSIDVADSGIGIPSSDLPRVFERFYRVDKSRSRNSGGTGLGLAIVKHAIESQGGTVVVTSKQGSGSTFTVKLPIPRTSE